MQAAVEAAQAGHKVILCEASDRLGGALKCEEEVPFKKKIKQYIAYQTRQIEKLPVQVRLNTPVTPGLAAEIAPDAIIAALGARAVVPTVLQGMDRDNVFSAEYAYTHTEALGQRVVIMGAGLVGVELGIYLSNLGKAVTIIEKMPFINNGGNILHQLALNVEIAKSGLEIVLNVEANTFTYLDVMTGEVKRKSWKDGGTTDNKQLTFNLNYDFKNGNHLDVSSKFKWGKVSMAMSAVSGIVAYDPSTVNKYYYASGKEFTGDHIQNRWMMYVPGFEHDWLTTAKLTGKSKNGLHSWRIGANVWYNRGGIQQMNTVMAHEVKANPHSLYVKDANGNLVDYMALNPGSGEFYDGHEFKGAVYLSDDWTATNWLWMSIGTRLEYLGYGGNAALNKPAGETYNSRTMGWSLKSPGAKMDRFHGDWLNPAFTYSLRAKILPGFGFDGEYVYVRQRPNLQDYAGSELPTTSPVNINMARAGIYWNNSWIKLVSQFSFITQTNYKSRTTFYNTTATGEESVTFPITYNIQTMGWTTDVVLTPFKGAALHALLTIQDPVYKKFHMTGTFPSGKPVDVDVSDNTVTAMSKTLIELDPSYSFNKFRFWLSFRYFSKQYINKTNSLYFNGHWESFGGINYALSPKINFALNVVNIFNQSGATGSISAADLVEDTTPYKNYLMSGSYIRPFEVSLSTTINF